MNDVAIGGALLPRCDFCRQVPALGIKGGYKLVKGFICLDCEAALVQTDTGSLYYSEWVDKMKVIFK